MSHQLHYEVKTMLFELRCVMVHCLAERFVLLIVSHVFFRTQLIKSKVGMEKQIRANSVVIGAQKSSYKYIQHNHIS